MAIGITGFQLGAPAGLTVKATLLTSSEPVNQYAQGRMTANGQLLWVRRVGAAGSYSGYALVYIVGEYVDAEVARFVNGVQSGPALLYREDAPAFLRIEAEGTTLRLRGAAAIAGPWTTYATTTDESFVAGDTGYGGAVADFSGGAL